MSLDLLRSKLEGGLQLGCGYFEIAPQSLSSMRTSLPTMLDSKWYTADHDGRGAWLLHPH